MRFYGNVYLYILANGWCSSRSCIQILKLFIKNDGIKRKSSFFPLKCLICHFDCSQATQTVGCVARVKIQSVIFDNVYSVCTRCAIKYEVKFGTKEQFFRVEKLVSILVLLTILKIYKMIQWLSSLSKSILPMFWWKASLFHSYFDQFGTTPCVALFLNKFQFVDNRVAFWFS